MDSLLTTLKDNDLVVAFALVGLVMAVAILITKVLTRGKFQASAIAIILGLVLAYIGGVATGGENGLADLSLFSGVGLVGGGMLINLAIVATGFGASFDEMKKSGMGGIIALVLGVVLSFVIGAVIAWFFGYRDPVDLTTIGAGTATYIVGPVTGAALGAGSGVIALSVGAGLVKSVLTMVATPFVAKYIGLNNPHSAIVFGGLLGTTSGVTAGLAATDKRLVPYGAMTSTFYTGLGLLMAPSVLFFAVRALVG
ncbi:malonate transporter subunit MadM [Brevibacterium zhoupengii]|uniref:malonate transporter subunit MadM n=1 Tax=Brevibacterium zhoupengii TaxID=2898795 RepID=UPI001E4B27B2|nr:malonate transporter subunit MadM [Brevibacterium zhoupengii]